MLFNIFGLIFTSNLKQLQNIRVKAIIKEKIKLSKLHFYYDKKY